MSAGAVGAMWGGGRTSGSPGGSRRSTTRSSTRSRRARASAGSTSRPATARWRFASPRRAPSVTGVDIAPSRCSSRRARRAAQALDVGSTAATRSALPFDDAEFDVVASSFGVIFAPDRGAGRRGARPRRATGGTARAHDLVPDERAGRASSSAVVGSEPRADSTAGATRREVGASCSATRSSSTIERAHLAATGADAARSSGSSSRSSAPPIKAFLGTLDDERRSSFAGDSSSTGSASRRATSVRRPTTTCSCSARAADGDRSRSATRPSSSCRRCIRLDTVNPPGNETLAAELLRDYLAESGVESRALRARARAREPRRAPARAGDGPRLAFLSHTDTVLADPAEWAARSVVGRARRRRGLGPRRARHEGPGGGERRRARVARARGLPAAGRPHLHRRGRRGGRQERSACSGSAGSIRTPCASTTRSTRAAASGSSSAASPYYLCATAEKMTAPFRLRVHGRSGHASMPGIADNALVKAARPDRAARRVPAGGRDRARGGRLPGRRARRASRPPAEVLDAAARDRSARGRADRAAALVHALADDDHGLGAAERHPRHVRRDRRLPAAAGQTPEDVEPISAACSATDDYELESIERWGGTRSPLETPLWDAIESWVETSSPAPRRAVLLRRASRTRTGCARRSARSRTASSRCGRWSPSSRRG